MSGIVVIGSGLAGLCAAEGALSAGAKDVTIISASLVGTTQLAPWGVLRTRGVKSQNVYDSILEYGRYISDQVMLEIFVEKLVEAVEFVKNFIELLPAPNVGVKIKGGGSAISRQLVKRLEGLGGKFVSAECIEIITENNVAKGVIVTDGERCWNIAAQAVILATGGGTSIFYSSDNPITQTGSGYAIALKAGAVLRDMEFQIYHPMARRMGMSKCLRYRMLEMFKLENCTVTDMDGNRLLEIEELLNTHESHNQLSEMALKIRPYGDVYIHTTTEKLCVRPVVHSFLGGVVIDRHGQTGVDGLFACGEVVGGLNGANRLAATAFPEAIIFGRIAGESAVRYILNSDNVRVNYTPQISFNSQNEGCCIEKLMDEHLFLIKNEQDIIKALSELRSIRKKLPQTLEGASLSQIRYYQKTLLAEAIALAALYRKESRGAFRRSDFTEEKKEFEKNIYIKLQNGELSESFE